MRWNKDKDQGCGSDQVIGFKDGSLIQKRVLIQALILFKEKCPKFSPGDQFGIGTYYKWHRRFMDDCKPDQWMLISDESVPEELNDGQIILIIDDVLGKQEIHIAQITVYVDGEGNI